MLSTPADVNRSRGGHLSISEAGIVKEKQALGDRHGEPGAGGEDTNQSEKDKQEKCENQLPLCVCAEGEGSDCSSQEGSQLHLHVQL